MSVGEINLSSTPQAFVCHASEDKPTAERMATDLRKSGIETFLDKWEIRSGDSLRMKVDEGLGRCTHFIALLSPVSLSKPWVNAEIDAGFMRRINAQAAFIPVRLGLDPKQLPPLLSGLFSPSIDDYASGIKTLIEDIHGIAKKPPLGAPSQMLSSSWARPSGLSIGAARIAEIFVLHSKNGRRHDPEIDVAELRDLTGYSDEQLMESIDELEEDELLLPNRVMGAYPFGYHSIHPSEYLFTRLDSRVMGWNPAEDAKALATILVNEFPNGGQVGLLAQRLGLAARRTNPALTVLCSQDLVMFSRNMHPVFVTSWISATPRTRRLLRDS
jgi:hypothetical protein